MRIFKTIITILIIAVFLIFAIQNNVPIDVSFANLNIVRQIPLFVVLIIVFILGFLWGRVSGWVNNVFVDKKPKKDKDKDKDKQKEKQK